MLWVLVDEDVSGLNDGAFAFRMDTPKWIDIPGTYHAGGCGFAFADGHSETHKWTGSGMQNGGNASATDWNWMRERTSSSANP